MKRISFEYQLPEDKIAKHPVSPRHNSKLLQYKAGKITDHVFFNLAALLPESSLIIMNNAKVIPARIFCQKPSGAAIEVFLLEPVGDYLTAFSSKESGIWKTLVGNKKRWKDGILSDINGFCTIEWVNRDENTVKISWKTDLTFAQVLEKIGKMPIPPYLNRPSIALDEKNYQTNYAKVLGSVAAPTAGLHFTESIFTSLQTKGIHTVETTLHVGAGTFKPVDAEWITDHEMHSEKFELSLNLVNTLLAHKGPKIAVGTTSLRVLESIYFIGLNIKNKVLNPLEVKQEQVAEGGFSYMDCLLLLKDYLTQYGDQNASTAIFIYPGKKIQSVDAIITNFHQSSSTLVMLIAALIGPNWESVYAHALQNDYRFLSYGDSSLLWF